VDEQEASQPYLDMVGLTEIASMLEVSKQRVQELAENDRLFPAPIGEYGGTKLYLRSMAEAYSKHRRPTRGRPFGLQHQVSEETTHIPKDRQNPVQQSLRMIYNIRRLHDLRVDKSASRHQSLFLALRDTTRQEGDRPRYDDEFFQPEPPDQRYRILHVDCCNPGGDESFWDAA